MSPETTSFGSRGASVGSATNGRAADILKLLNLIYLLFDSHLGEPEALVDAPLFENLFHVRLTGLFWGRVALGALAGLGQDYNLVHVLFSFNDVLVGAWH